MKTPEEIKKGLAACSADECHGQHEGCTYQDQLFCTMRMCGDALAYIQQLESRLAQAERERDAAVNDLKEASFCRDCLHYDVPAEKEPCLSCLKRMHEKPKWQWRGVCPENTKEDDHA